MSTPPTIERTSGSVVHQTPFVTVTEDQVVFPGGRAGSYTTVTPGTGFGAVTVVRARTKAGPKYALVTQYRYPLGASTLEFPRGGTEDLSGHEALREVIEETGGGEGLRPDRLGTIHPDTGLLRTEVGVWVLTLPHLPGAGHTDVETGGGVRWVSEGELIGLIQSGQVTCAMTLAAFAMLATSSRYHLPD